VPSREGKPNGYLAASTEWLWTKIVCLSEQTFPPAGPVVP
jgi:hypothetical protein